MANYYLDENGNLTKKKKKKGNNYILQDDGTMQLETYEEDIAPVKTTTATAKDEEKWYDGYFQKSEGNIAQTILGTLQDANTNLFTGIAGMGEKVVDAGAYLLGGVGGLVGADEFQDDMEKFIEKDLYDEKKVGKFIGDKANVFGSIPTALNYLGLDIDEEKHSVLGDKSDSLVQSGGQLLGTVGLQAVGVPWFVTTGVTSFGGEVESAFNDDATYLEAGGSGLITAGADILTEKLFGGSGLGEKGLLNLEPLTKGITNKVVKALSDFGVDVIAEGSEEVFASIVSNLGTALYKEENVKDLLFSEEAIDEYIESFIGGAVLGGGMNSVNVASSIKNGTDYRTGLTENETKVVEKEVENRVAEREADGTKVDNKEKSAIREEVMNDLDKGYISLDTIESTLGGETYETYKSLNEKENSLREEITRLQNNPSATAQNRLTEAKAELEAIEKGTEKTELKDRLSLEVQELTKSERLSESYNEKARRSQKFEADLTKYDAKAQETIKKATESGILNNTNRTHEFVDMIAKLSADKGVSFDFTNNENLKKSGFALEGKTVNGLVKDNDIILNVDSSKALNTVVGHEITHVLEGTELYTELQNVVKQYATTKGEYDTRYKAIQELYKDVEGANIDNELTAELVGEYLFTDSDFVNNLSATKPNVFKKIYDEIKYLYKVATAGSKEARQLEKVKKAFDKAYKESSKTADDKKTRYSLEVDVKSEVSSFGVDNKMNDYIGVQKSVIPKLESEGYFGEVVNEETGMIIEITKKGIKETLGSGKRFQILPRDLKELKLATIRKLPQILREAHLTEGNAKNIHGEASEFAYFEIETDINGVPLKISLDVKRTSAKNKFWIHYVDITKENSQLLSSGKAQNINETGNSLEESITDNSENASGNVKYSLSEDSNGNAVSPAVQKRFENSKAVDETGSLKVLYHGTPSGEFTIFDKSKGSVEGDFGSGFYFTDNEADVETNYEGGGPDFENKVSRRAEQIEYEEDIDYDEAEQRAREELYKGSNKFEVYLNIENPAIVGKTTLLSQDDYLENYNPDDYDDYDDYLGDVEQLVADDIENIVWEVEKNVDVYSTDGLADVLYEAYYEGGIGIEELKHKINELYLEDSNGNMVGNEVTRQIIESLGYDGIIDSTVSSKFKNMGLEEGTTHYIVFKPNQIKSITNENPTDNPDINLSLSKDNQRVASKGNYNVYGKDIALETAPIQELAPVKEVSVENAPTQEVADDFAPMTEAQANERDALYSIDTLDESQMPDEVEAPYYETEDVKLDDPFLERDIKDVGKRNVNAYMYDNPEVKPYFQEEAQNMLWELKNSVKGEKSFNDQLYYDTNGEQGWFGTKRETSDDIAYLLDNHGYTYADIEKGLNAIIEDHGAENNAISKRIEFAINDRLKDGYTDFMSGSYVPANQDYVNLLMDKQINSYSDEAYNQYLESLAQEYAGQDIAPVRQQYEAIEPAPQSLDAQEQEWANNKMARAKDTNKVTSHKVEAKQRRWVETSTESEVVNREILPDDLDLSKIVYEPIPNKVTLGKANAKLGTLGYDESLAYFNNQLAGKKASLEDIALGERLLQEAMKKGDTATAGELIQNISILGTELGQKVQALSIIQRLTPEGQLKMLYKTVKRGKVKGDKAFEGVELTQEMIDHILKTYKADGTYDQNELNKAVEDVKDKLAKSMEVSTIDKVNAWRYLAMLGNPKTHIRNLVSNVAMKGTVAVKNAVARTVEEIAPISNRTKTWRRATDEVKAFAETTTLEMKDVISEDTKYSEEASIKSKRDMFKNNILNKLYEFNNDLMTKEDWWFSKSAYKNSLSEYLTANGIETSKDIENNPKIVEKAKQYALEQSQIATFRQYSWLANKIREVESKNVATEVAVGSILPFKKTPINIAKAGLSYSPLGFAKALTYDVYQMKQGKMQASQVVDNLAQGVTGSALVYVGYMLAMSGLLSGGGEDDKEGKYDYQLGEQAYSLNIGGNSYSLSWLSPVAMPLFIGANAYEQLVEGEEWNGDVVMETLAQTLDPLSEMSFLSSLDSVLSSYDSGVEKFAGIGEAMIQNYATQFIPTLSSQVATVLDDKKRSTKVAGDSEFKIVDETINKLKYKIPFLRETLEPTTDIWGNEVKQSEDMIERALETFIAPYSRKENIATEIDAEIKDLYAQTGDNGIIPNIPYNYVNYDGEKYKMSASEYTDFKKTYGQMANDLLEDLFKTTTYQNATSEERVDLVNEVYDYASDTAKLEYLEKEGVDYEPSSTYGNIKGAIENDMSLDEFDLFTKDRGKYYISKAIGGYETYDTYKNALNDIEGDKDENGNTINGSVKANVESYINGLPLDYGQKILLFTSKYPKDDTYKADIVEYLNERSDITYEEMKAILEGLNYTIEADGTVRW